MEHDAEPPLIAIRERIESGPEPGQDATGCGAGVVLGVGGGEKLICQQRDDRQGQHQRHQHADRQRQRQGREELARHSFQQPKREKHHDRGHRARSDRPEQFLHGETDGRLAVAAETEVPDDVFGNDYRVVDHQPDRDRHGAEGHQIEGLTQQTHQKQRHGQRERDRRRADDGDPDMAQEQQQDPDGQRRADQDRVPHRGHRVPHQGRLIVHRLQPDTGRERLRHVRGRARHAVAHRDGVAADLPGDTDQRGRTSIPRDDPDVVLGSWHHGGEVSNPEGALDHHVGHVLHRVRFLRRHNQILLVVAGDAAHRIDRDPGPDRLGQAVVGEPRGRQTRRIRHDLDLPHVGSLDVHPPDAGNPRQHRLDLIAGDVVERGGIAALEIVGKDREEARREPLDFDREPRGEIAPDLLDPGPDQLERPVDVGGFSQRDVHFARPANRTTLHPHDSGYDADGFFDRPGHREHDLPGPKA